MVSILTRTLARHVTDDNGVIRSVNLVEAYGLSTDVKPTRDIANASVFFEMDTKTTFFFNEENGRWI